MLKNLAALKNVSLTIGSRVKTVVTLADYVKDTQNRKRKRDEQTGKWDEIKNQIPNFAAGDDSTFEKDLSTLRRTAKKAYRGIAKKIRKVQKRPAKILDVERDLYEPFLEDHAAGASIEMREFPDRVTSRGYEPPSFISERRPAEAALPTESASAADFGYQAKGLRQRTKYTADTEDYSYQAKGLRQRTKQTEETKTGSETTRNSGTETLMKGDEGGERKSSVIESKYNPEKEKYVAELNEHVKQISTRLKSARGSNKFWTDWAKDNPEKVIYIGDKRVTAAEYAREKMIDLRTITYDTKRFPSLAKSTEVIQKTGELEKAGDAAKAGITALTSEAVNVGSSATKLVKASLLSAELLGMVFDVALNVVFLGLQIAEIVEQTKEDIATAASAHPFRDSTTFSEDYRKDAREYFLKEMDNHKESKSVREDLKSSYSHDQKFWDGYQAFTASNSKSEQDFYDKYFHAVKNDASPIARHTDYRDWGHVYTVSEGTMTSSGDRASSAQSGGEYIRDHADLYRKDRATFSLGTADKRLESHREQQVKADPNFVSMMYRVALGANFDSNMKAFSKGYQPEALPNIPPLIIDSRLRTIRVESETKWDPYNGNVPTGKFTAYANGTKMTDAEFVDTLLKDKTYGKLVGSSVGLFGTMSGDMMSQYVVDWFNVNKDKYYAQDVEEYERKVSVIPPEPSSEIPPPDTSGEQSSTDTSVGIPKTNTVTEKTTDQDETSEEADDTEGNIIGDNTMEIPSMCSAWANVCFWANLGGSVYSYYNRWVPDHPETSLHYIDVFTGVKIGLNTELIDFNKRVYVTVNNFDVFASPLLEGNPTSLSDYQYNSGVSVQEESGAMVNTVVLKTARRLVPILLDLFSDAGELGKIQRVVFCGRGYGGAVAALLAVEPPIRDIVEVVTAGDATSSIVSSDHSTRHYGFSMPRIGNNAFASHAKKEQYIKFHRVSLDNDVITRYPLMHSGYVHFGEEWVLHEDGGYTTINDDGTSLSRVVDSTPFNVTAGIIHNSFADSYGKVVKMQNSIDALVKELAGLYGITNGGVEFTGSGVISRQLPSVNSKTEEGRNSSKGVTSEIKRIAHFLHRGSVHESHFERYFKHLKGFHSSGISERLLKAHIISYAHSQKNPANSHRGVRYI